MPVRPQQQLEILQCNLNHSARAQDLMMQVLAEWGLALAIIAEPYAIPPQPNWVGSTDERVAITVPVTNNFPPLAEIARGQGYAAAKWGKIVLIAVYFSPNQPLVAFERFLEVLGGIVQGAAPAHVMVLGDLNAKSEAWGCQGTDPKGAALRDWVTAAGMAVLNQGNTNTCVRRQGGSIVDVSFATPTIAAQVSEWRVLDDIETLSDHLYIRMRVTLSPSPAAIRRGGRSREGQGGPKFPRWSLAGLDREIAEEVAIVEAWGSRTLTTSSVEEHAERFRESLTAVCDAAMPRVRRRPARRRVYWWTEEISSLRAAADRARRAYTRSRRRQTRSLEEEELLYGVMAEANKALKVAIARGKDAAREEFLATLDRDPWGRPYRLVRNKLKCAPPLDSMEPELLTRIVEGLFPRAAAFAPPVMAPPLLDAEEDPPIVPPIGDDEMEDAVNHLRSTRKAPGPDGVPGKVLHLALKHLGARYKALLDDCLKEARFPRCWKEGRLCLLRKEGRPPDSPSGYRPLVLLDEAAKVLERIVAARIARHLRCTGPDVCDRQFGFRVGRSTMDAVSALKEFADYAAEKGESVVAVSLDIANAFGSLPYEVIGEALRFHGVPLYLRRVVEHYLLERVVLFEDAEGRHARDMTCGVPQGSVLGPLLWNLGYDWAIRGIQLPRMTTICYADDTMVAVRGSNMRETMRRAEVATELTIRRISLLGLKVSLPKTEAIVFGGRGWRVRADLTLRVGEEDVQVRPHIKYLGLTLDRRWNFREHFKRLAPRIVGAASALGRLLPNEGGPEATCRRLFAGVIRSMALYGAPIWAERLTERTRSLLRRPQRVVALRICRAYSTVSYAAACLLASTPPWELDARVLADRYKRRVEARASGEISSPEEAARAQREDVARLRSQWSTNLESSPYGTRTIGAILPSLSDWLKRKHGALSYRLTQMLTGHGCFGHYLHSIGRELGPECHECGDPDDTAQHSLEVCSHWDEERRTLRATVGNDLSLSSVITAMLRSDVEWKAVASFCEQIQSQKEEAERAREDSADAPPLRRRRRGTRRSRFIAAIRQNPL